MLRLLLALVLRSFGKTKLQRMQAVFPELRCFFRIQVMYLIKTGYNQSTKVALFSTKARKDAHVGLGEHHWKNRSTFIWMVWYTAKHTDPK